MYGWNEDPLDAVGFLLGCYLSPSLPRNVSPVWTMLIGPASCGKSSLFQAYTDLPWTVGGDNFTENAMASASISGKGRDFSILHALCEETEPAGSKVWMIPEFSTIALSAPIKVSKFFADLRHIYDGRYVNRSGGHGEVVYNLGRVGFMAAYTREKFVRANSVLGERMLLFRMFRTFRDTSPLEEWHRMEREGLPIDDPRIIEFQDCAAKLTRGIVLGAKEALSVGSGERPQHSESDLRFVSSLGKLGAMLRAFPDGGVASEPESPHRLTRQLTSWADSFCVAVGREKWDDDCKRIMRRAAASSITQMNLELLRRLWGGGAEMAVYGTMSRKLLADLSHSTVDDAEQQLRQWLASGLIAAEGRRYFLSPGIISLIDETSFLESV